MKDYVFKQNKEVIFRDEGDEAIIFNPQNSEIIVINSIGRFIWSLCDGKNTKKEILKKILDEFEVSSEKAEQDLDKFLTDLEKAAFIKQG
ncbi:MAG: PqqD family protein [Candidatus Omnitrophica bacterium]|nr:PqqD family protein [Candidatus Omnitrophota bacterium]